MSRPLILSPAGSPEALEAALKAGADEIYFGLEAFNARGNAKNFTAEDAARAFRACRTVGVKTNITLNTLVSDRELDEAVRLAYHAACMGADAFIVQDTGLARTLKKAMPTVTLHASTQCACHSVAGAEALLELGFSRLVLARELDREEIEKIVALGAETEVFVHGALCVCHSGLCLMSSVIGKRSGNRGLCAQPCRLPYTLSEAKKGQNGYPLSLKDLSLCEHVPTLSELGITSLKIEGRMKPPAYVAGVTEVWKRLVTENRSASREEREYLEALFSRNGFTDAYFTGSYRANNRSMYGVRTEADKRKSEALTETPLPPRKRPVSMSGTFRIGQAPTLSLSVDGIEEVCVRGDFTVQAATTEPMSEAQLTSALSKLGGTSFAPTDIRIQADEGLFVPKSQLNALRRAAVEALEKKLTDVPSIPFTPDAIRLPTKNVPPKVASARLRLYPATLEGLARMLERYDAKDIESVCLPLGLFDGKTPDVSALTEHRLRFGVRMPRVLFSKEEAAAEEALRSAAACGAAYAVAENIGDISLILASGLALYGGAALNVYNSQTLAVLAESGMKSITLSPELNTAQMRDLVRPTGIETELIGAGRLELMVLESCVIRACGKCRESENGAICATLTDRIGMHFPIRAEKRLGHGGYPCRNVVLNSVPLRLFEKSEEIGKAGVEIVGVYEDFESI